MFTYIYDWIKNLVFYLILMTMLMQIIPDSDYKKYIRFFYGSGINSPSGKTGVWNLSSGRGI